MIEKDVKARVNKLLDKYSWFHWMPPSNAFGKAGIADINAVKYGLFLAIETKVGKGRATPLQKRFLASVREHSGFAFEVNETRLDALEEWLATQRFLDGTSDPLTEALSEPL